MKWSYRRRAEEEEVVEVEIAPLDDRHEVYRVSLGDRVFELSARLFYRVAFVKAAGEMTIQVEGREYHLFDAAQQRRSLPRGSGDLRAPMAGKIIQVLVQPGDHVTAGDPLLILEAMKMEQQIMAPRDGVIERVQCREGDQVTAGMELVVLTPEETGDDITSRE